MRLDRRLRWQQWEVPRRARAVHADLLHVPGFDAPRWKPCPVVLTVHDLIGMLSPRNLPPSRAFRLVTMAALQRPLCRSRHRRLGTHAARHRALAENRSCPHHGYSPGRRAAISTDRAGRHPAAYPSQAPPARALHPLRQHPRAAQGHRYLAGRLCRARADGASYSVIITGQRGWYTERTYSRT